MATQTTYYEFNKPEGTDLVNPLVDTNPNWDLLDADLHDFNLRSIANCNEVVTLGVHAISRLDQTAKFLKWIATANFTAGDTFTVDGLVVAASTPAGASLQTNAYVTGSIVLACLNADNSAMTIFVSGTTVADDSNKLGGELPSYYGTASDVADNASDITNLQNQVGNTSIVGIGDGTCTGAIDALNTKLNEKIIAQVTCDGVKSRSTIFNEIWAQILSQREKLKNALISYEGNQYRCMVYSATEASFSQVGADANGANIYTITCKTSGSTMRYSHVGNNPAYNDISSGVPAADTVYYVIIPADTF